MTSATARGAATARLLLQAAVDEWVSAGEVEVAAVARRAGVSAGLPYRYFGTRSGLLIALVQDFYDRLGEAAAMRLYADDSWAGRERARIADWVKFLYDDPLSAVLLAGPVGDGAVMTEHTRRLDRLAEVGARNIEQAQRARELPADRDPAMLAAAILSGVHAMGTLALTRRPRPAADDVVRQVWTFVAGAAGCPKQEEK